jgi:hypothetical protein
MTSLFFAAPTATSRTRAAPTLKRAGSVVSTWPSVRMQMRSGQKYPQGKALNSRPNRFMRCRQTTAGFQTLSWPYEVVAIELVNFRADVSRDLFFGHGGATQPWRKGFDLFRKECLKCHSLNLQGGDIGPELNVPQNITEYRAMARR